jgi:hypothetical protein
MIKVFLLNLLTITALSGIVSAQNQSGKLFDGKTLQGWHTYLK